VPWIWFGGLIVALGAVVSAWPTARTSRREARATAPRAVRASSGPVPEFS
jgi:cytochrome c biogenesis factor